MGCSWEQWSDSIRMAGLGPEDVDKPDVEPPTEVVVSWMQTTRFRDVDTGKETTIDAPCSRSWPLFCSRAAFRFFAYAERRWGKGNVWVEEY